MADCRSSLGGAERGFAQIAAPERLEEALATDLGRADGLVAVVSAGIGEKEPAGHSRPSAAVAGPGNIRVHIHLLSLPGCHRLDVAAAGRTDPRIRRDVEGEAVIVARRSCLWLRTTWCVCVQSRLGTAEGEQTTKSWFGIGREGEQRQRCWRKRHLAGMLSTMGHSLGKGAVAVGATCRHAEGRPWLR